MTMTDATMLRDRFERACSAMPASAEEVATTFDGLVVRHLEAHRAWHTLERLQFVFEAADAAVAAGAKPDEPLAFELAVFFHDVVRDPRAHDNGQRSAFVASEELHRLDAPPGLVVTVTDLILQTDDDVATSADGRLLRDVDAAVWGATPGLYATYLRRVRDEYAFLSHVQWYEGRIGFLESLLARDRLYDTAAARALWESAARQNLAGELRWIRSRNAYGL